MTRVGIHTSIAGGLHRSALRAEELGCDCFQIFSRNPRGWSAPPLTTEEPECFLRERERAKLRPLVVHDCYLVNLAADREEIWRKSVAAFRDEIQRVLALKTGFLVFHPGSPKSLGREKGIERTVSGLLESARGLKITGLTNLVENTAGMGSALGFEFVEIQEIIQGGEAMGLPMGCCVDTQHLFAAGLDISDAKGLERTLRALDKTIGLQKVRLVHANDSKVPLGGRLDRHEHIGKGHIGMDGFRRIMNHPSLSDLPFILETPIEGPGADQRNLQVLRSLMNSSRTNRSEVIR